MTVVIYTTKLKRKRSLFLIKLHTVKIYLEMKVWIAPNVVNIVRISQALSPELRLIPLERI
jgi:hypothetical protein